MLDISKAKVTMLEAFCEALGVASGPRSALTIETDYEIPIAAKLYPPGLEKKKRTTITLEVTLPKNYTPCTHRVVVLSCADVGVWRALVLPKYDVMDFRDNLPCDEVNFFPVTVSSFELVKGNAKMVECIPSWKVDG